MISIEVRRSAVIAALLVVLCTPGCRLSGHTQKGEACWYGPGYHGRPTASGAIYDEEKMTAAHKKWPFGTVVRVKNLKNGRTVTVTINDRGPFKRGRIIDLSKRAARELGMLSDGVVPVRIEVIKWGAG